MSLTPKETGGAGAPVFPVDIPYSAVIETPPTSVGDLAYAATLAFSFKPTVVDDAKPLHDPANHALVVIGKTGTSCAIYADGVQVRSALTITGTTAADILAECLEAMFGDTRGYLGNLYVIDGVVVDWTHFFEVSARVPGLYVWKKDTTWSNNGPNVFTGGTVTSSHTSPYGRDADTLFDGGLGAEEAWYPSNSLASVAQPEAVYDFGAGVTKRITRYMMQASERVGAAGFPRDWTIYGSNDGSTWDTVDTVSMQGGWSRGAVFQYECDSPGDYRYYKLKVTYAWTNSSETVLNMLGEWEGYESVVDGYGPNGGHYPFLYANNATQMFVGGTASTNSQYDASYPPENAFDGRSDLEWHAAGGVTSCWLQYTLATQKTLFKYTIQARGLNGAAQSPKSWTIQGSNNGTDWTVLDTETDVTGWTNLSVKSFTVDNPGSYSMYRMDITETGGSTASIAEWVGYDTVYVNGLGTDTSGNGNDWTFPSDAAQSTDTPTNNLPVINPVPDVGWTLSEGNLRFVGDADSDFMLCTLPCVDGCYWELEWDGGAGAGAGIASQGISDPRTGQASMLAGSADLYKFDGTQTTFALVPQARSTLMFAYRNGNLWIGVDGVWEGDPEAFAGPTDATIAGAIYPMVYDRWSGNIPEGRFRFAEHELQYPVPVGFRPLKQTF